MATNKPKPIPVLSAEEIEHFWSKVDKRGPDECWPWIGNCFKSGYGRYSLKGDSQNAFKASRIAYFLITGDDPGEFLIRHSCDNPPCCNGGKHLLKGTSADNSRDMAVRGRSASGDRNGLRLHPESILRGENHPMRKHNGSYLLRGKDHWTNKHPEWISGERNPAAKLTSEDVLRIRSSYYPYVTTYSMLAAEYGVNRHTIMRIVLSRSHQYASQANTIVSPLTVVPESVAVVPDDAV